MLKQELMKMLDYSDVSDQTHIAIDGLDTRYNINRKGVIWDHKHSKPIFPQWRNNALWHRLFINNEFIYININKLYLMAFSPMHTDFHTYMEHLAVIVYDNRIILPCIDNLCWKLLSGGVFCMKHPGYFSVVGNPGICVSDDYKFINYESGRAYKITYPKDKNRYPVVGSLDDDKSNHPLSTRLVHRLVALAFLAAPLFKKDLFINHKDGDKCNFVLSNIEWCTYKENNEHAFRSGLRSDNIPIIAINIDTHEKKYFYSIQDAARTLNMHGWDISVSKKVYKEKGFAKTAPWIFIDINEKVPTSFMRIKQKIIESNYKYFKIINEEANSTVYIRGIKNVSKFLGSSKYEKNIVNNEISSINKYTISKVHKCDVPLSVIASLKPPNDNRGGKVQKQIRVTDISNNTVITYNSTDQFAALVGAKRKTIQHSMSLNDGVWRNFMIEYMQ